MNRKFEGMALIITLSVLTGLCIAGLAFMALLNRDQKMVEMQGDQFTGLNALEAAIRAGLYEITDQLNNAPLPPAPDSIRLPYLGSTLEVIADPNSESSIFFRNVIRPTNAKLNIASNNYETWNVLFELTNSITMPPSYTGNFSTDIQNLIGILAFRHNNDSLEGSQYRPNSLLELVRSAKMEGGMPNDFNAITYRHLAEHLTAQPQNPESWVVNLIDYGQCADPLVNNKFVSASTKLKVGTMWTLMGNYVAILSGTGSGQESKIIDFADANEYMVTIHPPWAPRPDATSTYKIYSRVTPINFNRASMELILANFRVLASIPQINSLNIANVETEINNLRTPTNTPFNRIRTFEEWRTEFLDNIGGLSNPHKDLIMQLCDPNRPKAIDNGGIYEIPRLPMPFTFDHDGYFDMDITAGMKRHRANVAPQHVVERIVTVRVGGVARQALKEDFTNPGHFQQFVASSDFVPVRNMADFDNWEPVDETNFQPYQVGAVAPNVIPDAIKTGIWINFSMPNDEVFNLMNNTLQNTSEVLDGNNNQKMFNPTPGVTISLQPTPSTSEQLVVTGLGAIGPEVYLGRSNITPPALPSISNDQLNRYRFGDIGVMARLQDLNTEIFPTLLNENQIGPLHSWSVHADVLDTAANPSDNRADYPPRRFAKPGLFIWSNRFRETPVSSPFLGSDYEGLDLRPEHSYETGVPFNPAFPNCAPNSDGVLPPVQGKPYFEEYIRNNAFSLTKNHQFGLGQQDVFTSPLPIANNWERYRFNITASGTDGVSTPIRMARIEPPVNPSDPDIEFPETINVVQNQAPGIPPHGRFGFRRLFPTGYHPGGNTGGFGIDYLRIIAGERPPGAVAGSPLHPFYQSGNIPVPTGVQRYRKLRVYFQAGTKADGSVDNMRFRFSLNFFGDGITGVIPAHTFPSTPSHFINSAGTALGFFEFPLNLPPPDNAVLPDANNVFQYRLNIENMGADAAERFAFLRTTIAITKVEVTYDTQAEVVYSIKGY